MCKMGHHKHLLVVQCTEGMGPVHRFMCDAGVIHPQPVQDFCGTLPLPAVMLACSPATAVHAAVTFARHRLPLVHIHQTTTPSASSWPAIRTRAPVTLPLPRCVVPCVLSSSRRLRLIKRAAVSDHRSSPRALRVPPPPAATLAPLPAALHIAAVRV